MHNAMCVQMICVLQLCLGSRISRSILSQSLHLHNANDRQQVPAEQSCLTQLGQLAQAQGAFVRARTFLARRMRPRRCASCRRDPACELIWMSTFASGMSIELSPTLLRNTVFTCARWKHKSPHHPSFSCDALTRAALLRVPRHIFMLRRRQRAKAQAAAGYSTTAQLGWGVHQKACGWRSGLLSTPASGFMEREPAKRRGGRVAGKAAASVHSLGFQGCGESPPRSCA